MSVWDNDSPRTGAKLVRPYIMTGGRTGTTDAQIALEALVAATPDGLRRRTHFQWESAEIIARSRRETAVVELAALMEVPIGVVRVLAADLRAKGAVTITDPPSASDVGAEAYTDLLQKVLDGIKSL